VKCHAFAVVAALGCASDAAGEYPVDAVARLAPTRKDLPYVEGPIEVLGTGKPSNVQDGGPRTLAAYRVQLPDGLAPRVRLGAASCWDPSPLLVPGNLGVQELGVIQRVGDETHFFVPVRDGSGTVYVDTETTTGVTSRGGRNPQIVIAVSADGFRVLACGVLAWR
jgi:hypothetical protein